MSADGPALHSGKRVLEPVPGLSNVSTEEDVGKFGNLRLLFGQLVRGTSVEVKPEH